MLAIYSSSERDAFTFCILIALLFSEKNTFWTVLWCQESEEQEQQIYLWNQDMDTTKMEGKKNKQT